MEIVNQRDPEGKVIWPGMSNVEQYPWEDLGDITVEQAVLAADKCDDASVVALSAGRAVIWTPEKRPVALEFRFELDSAENIDDVLELYAQCDRITSAGAKAVDTYTRVGTLTIVTGTQDGITASTHFANVITETNGCWLSARTEVKPASEVDDQIARYLINAHGYSKWLFIASDRDSTTIHIWGRRL